MEDPFTDLNINCAAQLSILEACRKYNPKVKILFASTRQVYGRPQYLPVDERHPTRPVDVNGINKLAGEQYHRLYHDVYGLSTVVLRLTNTIGSRMRIKDARQTFVGIWIRKILENKTFEVWGGEQRRDFTYVEDVVSAFIAAIDQPNCFGSVYNLGGTTPVSLLELAEELSSIVGQKAYTLCHYPADRSKIDIGDYYSDDQAFRAATGWQPKFSLEQALTLSVSYYREHIQHYL
jgi:UDP-glucose 4-epimerase